MSGLPRGWLETSIGDVISPYVTFDPTRESDAEFRYVDIGSIDNSTQTIGDPKTFLGRDAPSRARRIIHEGDVLFSTVRTYLKNIATVPGHLDGALTSTGIAVLRAAPALDGRYLFHWVRSDEFVGKMSGEQDGTLYPAVTDKDVLGAAIPLPPLLEQRRIVAKVDGLTARTARARKELDRIPTLIARYKQRLLALAFSGELTAGWRRTRPVTQTLEQSASVFRANEGIERGTWPSDLLPDGWCWAPFEAAFKDVTDSTRKIPTREYQEHGKFPVVDQGMALIAGYTDREDMAQRAAPPYIVFGDHTRCVKLIRERFVQGADGVKVLNPTSEFDAAYLYFALQSVGLPDKGYSRHMKFLRATTFPKCTLEEQAEIVRRIKSAFGWLDRVAADHAAAARQLPRLDAAILARAFRGELVPQNPEDEPASALLARITAEREAQSKKPGARRGRPRKPAAAQAQAPYTPPKAVDG